MPHSQIVEWIRVLFGVSIVIGVRFVTKIAQFLFKESNFLLLDLQKLSTEFINNSAELVVLVIGL